LAIFVFLDFIKVIIFKSWSFELTAKLWPTPKRKTKLAVRRNERENHIRVNQGISKLNKVLTMLKVIRVFREASNEKEQRESSNSDLDQNNNSDSQ